MLDDTQDVGILSPAVLLKRYQAVANALSHLYDEPTVACVTLRSASLFRT